MKKFHITGTCIPTKNYMVDISKKLDQIMTMIEDGDYFVINRPRQYGKTTTLSALKRRLLGSEEYLPISISFEGIGDAIFRAEEVFCPNFLLELASEANVERRGYAHLFLEQMPLVNSFQSLSKSIKTILSKIPKKVVLMIDEVDKSTNFEMFLLFLGMLRTKYLSALDGDDVTFHCIILAGVNDIKSLKQKIRPESAHKFNSPWNIAAEFEVDMSFSPAEIETMLMDYVSETGVQMDTKAISEKIYFWTSGYPFLVSYICKKIAEKIIPARQSTTWELEYIDEIVNNLKLETNTLFDVLSKNLDSYPELYEMMENIILGLVEYNFDLTMPLISLSAMYGFISCNERGKAQIHNRLFQQKIISFVAYRHINKSEDSNNLGQQHYIGKDGRFNMDNLLLRFQEVMKAKWSKTIQDKSDEFLEKDLRLLFVMFIQPILNGKGHSFHEVQIGEEKRLDIIVTFMSEMFVIELKLWYSEPYHEKGKKQLKNYMQTMSIDKGYMLILDRSRKRAFKHEREDGMLMVYV